MRTTPGDSPERLDDGRPPLAMQLWSPDPEAAPYAFRMFGRFQVARDAESRYLDPGKHHELLAFLLFNYDRPHRRESIVRALWGSGHDPAKGLKSVRHCLWRLNESGLDSSEARTPLLLKDKNWIQVNGEILWLDVRRLKSAYLQLRRIPGEELGPVQACRVKRAVEVCKADLLEGWTGDWCMVVRERVRTMHLQLLEKLIGYSEVAGELDEGLYYGEQLLEHDRVHERVHRRMMRIHYLAGDRTAALRQFERCESELDVHMGIPPSWQTIELVEQMRRGVEPSRLSGAARPREHRRDAVGA